MHNLQISVKIWQAGISKYCDIAPTVCKQTDRQDHNWHAFEERQMWILTWLLNPLRLVHLLICLFPSKTVNCYPAANTICTNTLGNFEARIGVFHNAAKITRYFLSGLFLYFQTFWFQFRDRKRHKFRDKDKFRDRDNVRDRIKIGDREMDKVRDSDRVMWHCSAHAFTMNCWR